MSNKDENKTNTVSKEFIEKFVYYDETSPSCLRWKSNTKRKNKTAGGKSKVKSGKSSYTRWRIQIGDNKYIVARLILILHDYDLTDLYVDHKDGNPLNNLVSNLRCVSGTINARNLVRQTKNQSGVIGVRPVLYLGRLVSFMARWNENGVTKHKSFSTKEHGECEARSLATAYRKMKLIELNNQGYDYSERHINQVLQND